MWWSGELRDMVRAHLCAHLCARLCFCACLLVLLSLCCILSSLTFFTLFSSEFNYLSYFFLDRMVSEILRKTHRIVNERQCCAGTVSHLFYT